jgi:hypothetical protein
LPFLCSCDYFSCITFRREYRECRNCSCLYESDRTHFGAHAIPLILYQLTSALLQCLLPSKQTLRHGEEKLHATTARTGGVRFPSRELRPLRGRESQGHGLIEQMYLRP